MYCDDVHNDNNDDDDGDDDADENDNDDEIGITMKNSGVKDGKSEINHCSIAMYCFLGMHTRKGVNKGGKHGKENLSL